MVAKLILPEADFLHEHAKFSRRGRAGGVGLAGGVCKKGFLGKKQECQH